MGIKSFFNSIFGMSKSDSTTKGNELFDYYRISELLGGDSESIKIVLKKPSNYYKMFWMPKRRGGYRIISAPQQPLLTLQRKIYQRLLIDAPIHEAAKGFRRNLSIVDNAKAHLGAKNIIKVDIHSFFGTIKIEKVIPIFEKMGHSAQVSKQLAQLCCLNGRLPQGAPTSPALSNSVVYAMDEKLTALAKQYNLAYTRYADDLTFSGEFSKEELLPKIKKIIEDEGFYLNFKKTQYLAEKQRKIITGVSISSGKVTIPKAKKRELRKKIYYILKRGVAEHQAHIQSTDPAYLKRTIGYLSFWLSVEPNNPYVKKSLQSLKAILPK